MAFLLWMIGCISCGVATKVLNKEKGYSGGFWWGFFLGVIGIIIVLVRKEKPTFSYGDIKKDDKELTALEKLAIEKRKEEALASGGWKCIQCGRVNANYTGTCGCGMSKYDNAPRVSVPVELPKQKPKPEDEMMNLKKLKSYKDLLDAGVISQEDYDKKKAELLK